MPTSSRPLIDTYRNCARRPANASSTRAPPPPPSSRRPRGAPPATARSARLKPRRIPGPKTRESSIPSDSSRAPPDAGEHRRSVLDAGRRGAGRPAVALQFPGMGPTARRLRLRQAVLLRRRLFTGDLRATGDVVVDQLPPLRRCGFRRRAAARRPASTPRSATLLAVRRHYQGHAGAGADAWFAAVAARRPSRPPSPAIRLHARHDARLKISTRVAQRRCRCCAKPAEDHAGTIVQATSLGVEGMVITDLIARHACPSRWPRWTPASCTPRRWR